VECIRNKLPAPPADFEGREVIMHSLISSILDRRLVSLVGEEGVGKSSVATSVCKYIQDRKIFPDNVVFFRAKGLKQYHHFLKG
jgi:ABC-type dipeptide/oligopeptide/nickel transport system ATPase component